MKILSIFVAFLENMNFTSAQFLKTNHRSLLKHTIRKIKLIEPEKELSHVVEVNIDNAFTAITIDKEPMAITDSSRM